jgi:hypothetical protein
MALMILAVAWGAPVCMLLVIITVSGIIFLVSKNAQCFKPCYTDAHKLDNSGQLNDCHRCQSAFEELDSCESGICSGQAQDSMKEFCNGCAAVCAGYPSPPPRAAALHWVPFVGLEPSAVQRVAVRAAKPSSPSVGEQVLLWAHGGGR